MKRIHDPDATAATRALLMGFREIDFTESSGACVATQHRILDFYSRSWRAGARALARRGRVFAPGDREQS